MPAKKKPNPKTAKRRTRNVQARPGAAARIHPNDPALSALLARQEQILQLLENAVHSLDLGAAGGPLKPLATRLDSLGERMDLVMEALGLHPGAPRRTAAQAPGPAAAPASVPAAKSARPGAVQSAPDPDTAQFLTRTPLFAKLSPPECGLFAQSLETMALKAGAVLFRQGDFGDALYVVKTGSLEIYKNDVFGAVRVAEVRPGSLVGEMALVEDKPRSANVRAGQEDCKLLSLSRGAFAELKKAHPQIATKFQDELLLLLSGRLRQTTDRLVGRN